MPDLKPELSKKNKYWIPKHRYYELKHYCLQYPHWKELYGRLEFKIAERQEIHASTPANPTEKIAVLRADLKRAMELVEKCAKEAFPELYLNLLLAVTTGKTFEQLQASVQIPCSRDMYYDRYRKFFYILSQRRGL